MEPYRRQESQSSAAGATAAIHRDSYELVVRGSRDNGRKARTAVDLATSTEIRYEAAIENNSTVDGRLTIGTCGQVIAVTYNADPPIKHAFAT